MDYIEASKLITAAQHGCTVSTGSRELEQLLGGGIYNTLFYHFYGASEVRTLPLMEMSPESIPFLFLYLSYIMDMSLVSPGYWKIILVASILITILSLASLPYLYENISGDNIPNRPQREPPIEYQWDTAISRTIIALLSLGTGIYSYKQVRKHNR